MRRAMWTVTAPVLALLACHGGSGGGGGGAARLKANIGLDLANVIGFAIAGSGAATRVDVAPDSSGDAGVCDPSTLYAVMADGGMVVTTVTETVTGSGSGSGSEMVTCTTSTMTETATAIFDTPKYVVFDYQNLMVGNCSGSGSGGCATCPYVVMQKSDGALFCGAEDGDMLSPARVEGGSDLLYLGPKTLDRLDMSANPPKSTTIDDPSVTMDHIASFDVDAANDALVQGSFGERIFLASGGLQNITATGTLFQWLDSTAEGFYYLYTITATPMNPTLFDAFYVTGAAGSYTATLAGQAAGSDADIAPFGGLALATSTQAYAWANNFGSGAELVELLGSAGTCYGSAATACTADAQCNGTCDTNGPTPICNGGNTNHQCTTDGDCLGSCITAGAQHPMTGLAMIKNALGIGSTVFVQGTDAAGNGTVIAIDVSSFAQTTLLPAGDYTLTAISVSKTGELTFTGLRNSDGASVLGNCNPTCTVLNATAPAVSALQRIN